MQKITINRDINIYIYDHTFQMDTYMNAYGTKENCNEKTYEEKKTDMNIYIFQTNEQINKQI